MQTPGHNQTAGIGTQSAETWQFISQHPLLGCNVAQPAECLMLEPAGKEDELSAASLAVLAGQPYQPHHLLQRLVGRVHERLLTDLAAAQLLCFPVWRED